MLSGRDAQWIRSVVPASVVFGLGMGMFFWWGTQNGRFGVYAGLFSAVVFAWAMKRVVKVSLP